MKIYLLTQDDNSGYDTYDSIIVCAESEEDAKTISPYGGVFEEYNTGYDWANTFNGIKVEEIGEANDQQQRGLILSSYNAG